MPSPKRLKTHTATLRHLSFLEPVKNYKRGRGGRRGAICVTMQDHAEAVSENLAATLLGSKSNTTIYSSLEEVEEKN
jgi:hypothetical protein